MCVCVSFSLSPCLITAPEGGGERTLEAEELKTVAPNGVAQAPSVALW